MANADFLAKAEAAGVGGAKVEVVNIVRSGNNWVADRTLSELQNLAGDSNVQLLCHLSQIGGAYIPFSAVGGVSGLNGTCVSFSGVARVSQSQVLPVDVAIGITYDPNTFEALEVAKITMYEYASTAYVDEAVANAGGGVFVAEYGVTTYNEVSDACGRNVPVLLMRANRAYILSRRTEIEDADYNFWYAYQFVSPQEPNMAVLTLRDDNVWSAQAWGYAPASHASTHAPGGSDPLTGYAVIASGSYQGTGKNGTANKNTLTFSFEPHLVFIAASGQFIANYHEDMGGCTGWQSAIIWEKGATSYKYASGSTTATGTISVSGNTLSWYSTSNAAAQLNTSNTTYYYVAIGKGA